MNDRRIVYTPQAAVARAPLSQAVVANGMVYVSGTTPFNTERQMAPDFEGQMHQVMKNIQAVLAEAGTSLDHAVKMNVFLTDIRNFQTMNRIYASYFKEGNYPARTTIEAPMAVEGMLLEIECIAALP